MVLMVLIVPSAMASLILYRVCVASRASLTHPLAAAAREAQEFPLGWQTHDQIGRLQ
jgi:hypothetical protein